MDEATIERIRAFLEEMSETYAIEDAYLFGSRARGDHHEDSDVDLVVVSPDFEGLPTYLRAKPFYKQWSYPPDIEVKCYTPHEFDEQVRHVSIARTAVREGVAVA